MRRGFHIGLVLLGLVSACCFAATTLLYAQSAPGQQVPGLSQSNPPANAQQSPSQKPSSEANPFPEDTSNVPVVPTSGSPAPLPPSPVNATNTETTLLLREDTDPVRSPDDPAPGSSPSSEGFSSSLTGVDELKPPPDAEKPSKRKQVEEPFHTENAKQDENIGAYYLDQKNWKAALSRFESAVVLDPENPDVYWGMAEAQRQLGQFANAKANYQKVMEYDPDSKHGKEAKKYLKLPEIAKAPAVSANQPAGQPQ